MRIARYALFLLVATIVLLEVVLQVGAFVVSLRQPAAVAPDAVRGATILCVGDSWTHGMGASRVLEFSYPAQLQRELDERYGAGAWRVANLGRSGRNSREVLERLPAQLAKYEPRVVLCLVGQNDYWSTPEPLVVTGSTESRDDGFEWRFRTGRLVKWVLGKLAGEGQTAADEPRDVDPAWQPRVVETPPPPYPLPDDPWTKNREIRAVKSRAWALFEEQRDAEALALFEQVVADEPTDPEARHGLVQALRRADRIDDAVRHLEWLRRRYEETRGFWVGKSYVASLRALGRAQESLDASSELAARYPESGPLWLGIARGRFDAGDSRGALEAIDRAISIAENIWYYFWRVKFCLDLGDVDEAIRTVVRCYVVFNDAPWVRARFRSQVFDAAEERVRRIVAAADVSVAQRERLVSIVDEAYGVEESAISTVLTNHLGQIAGLARGAGAVPVFLSYPVDSQAYGVQRAAAAEHDVRYLDLVPRFAAVFETRPWDELRAPDGHCNDEGYALMARFVAEGLAPVLEGR